MRCVDSNLDLIEVVRRRYLLLVVIHREEAGCDDEDGVDANMETDQYTSAHILTDQCTLCSVARNPTNTSAA
jgi:hypothetical protein